LAAKLNFLITGAFPTVFDFLSPGWGMSLLGLVIIFLIILTPFIFDIKSMKLNLVVLLLAVASVFVPSTITAENWPTNRSHYPGQWVISSLALLALIQICITVARKLKIIGYFSTLSVLLLSLVIMNSNQLLMSTMRNPQVKELEAARIQIQRLNPSEPIEVKASVWSDSIAPWNFADEFGIPSTCQPWVPIPLTKLILLESNPGIVPKIALVKEITIENSIDYSAVLSSTRN
jgi:hypothetical protein